MCALDVLEETMPDIQLLFLSTASRRALLSISFPVVSHASVGRNSELISTTTGLVNPSCTGLLGNGVVIHLPSLFAELDALEAKGSTFTNRGNL